MMMFVLQSRGNSSNEVRAGGSVGFHVKCRGDLHKDSTSPTSFEDDPLKTLSMHGFTMAFQEAYD